jgi:hypothetical protein
VSCKMGHVCRPKELGGLGIHDLNRFGRALQQRWCWYRWTDEDRSWQGHAIPCDKEDRTLFQASTTIKLGNGEKATLWHDKWIDGIAPISVAPSLFKKVRPATYPLDRSSSNSSSYGAC